MRPVSARQVAVDLLALALSAFLVLALVLP